MRPGCEDGLVETSTVLHEGVDLPVGEGLLGRCAGLPSRDAVGVRGVLQRPPQGLVLEQRAEVVDLLDLLGGEAGDGEAHVRAVRHQPLSLEDHECLANRDPADPHGSGDCVDPDHGPWTQLPVVDLTPQLPEDCLLHGRRSERGHHLPPRSAPVRGR
jgi:hypothetical protein